MRETGNEGPRFIDIMLDDWFKRSFGEERSMEIAKNLLAKGFSMDDIADVTGIGVEELKKLQ